MIYWLLVAGAVGIASIAHAIDPSREGEFALALSPLPVSNEPFPEGIGNLDLAVRVTTDKIRYQIGELIFVTLYNSLATAIHAPPADPAYCSMVSVQKFEAGEWRTQGTCDANGTKEFISLGPNSLMRAALIRAPSQAGPGGPYFGKPATPGVLKGNHQTPPVESWKPGELVIVVPEGDINVAGLLHGTRDIALGRGTYRVVFSFTRGSRAGAVVTVHSEAFVLVPGHDEIDG